MKLTNETQTTLQIRIISEVFFSLSKVKILYSHKQTNIK